MWLNEKEEEEVTFDWSHHNPGMAAKKDSYSVQAVPSTHTPSMSIRSPPLSIRNHSLSTPSPEHPQHPQTIPEPPASAVCTPTHPPWVGAAPTAGWMLPPLTSGCSGADAGAGAAGAAGAGAAELGRAAAAGPAPGQADAGGALGALGHWCGSLGTVGRWCGSLVWFCGTCGSPVWFCGSLVQVTGVGLWDLWVTGAGLWVTGVGTVGHWCGLLVWVCGHWCGSLSTVGPCCGSWRAGQCCGGCCCFWGAVAGAIASAVAVPRHPPQAFQGALQTQWSWMLQLCCCIETHLRENGAYFQVGAGGGEGWWRGWGGGCPLPHLS